MSTESSPKHGLISNIPHWVLIGVLVLMLGAIISPVDLISGDLFAGPGAPLTLADDAGYLVVALLTGILETLKIIQKNKRGTATEGEKEVFESEEKGG